MANLHRPFTIERQGAYLPPTAEERRRAPLRRCHCCPRPSFGPAPKHHRRQILLEAEVIANIQEGFLPTGTIDTGLPTTLGGEIPATQTNGELSESTVSTGAIQQSIRAKILGSASNVERPLGAVALVPSLSSLLAAMAHVTGFPLVMNRGGVGQGWS
jgi:hypothetical protein